VHANFFAVVFARSLLECIASKACSQTYKHTLARGWLYNLRRNYDKKAQTCTNWYKAVFSACVGKEL